MLPVLLAWLGVPNNTLHHLMIYRRHLIIAHIHVIVDPPKVGLTCTTWGDGGSFTHNSIKQTHRQLMIGIA